MSLQDLVSYATRKEKFQTIENYTAFCAKFLEYQADEETPFSRDEIHRAEKIIDQLLKDMNISFN